MVVGSEAPSMYQRGCSLDALRLVFLRLTLVKLKQCNLGTNQPMDRTRDGRNQTNKVLHRHGEKAENDCGEEKAGGVHDQVAEFRLIGHTDSTGGE